MKIKVIAIIAISLVFVFTSVAVARETSRWMTDHRDHFAPAPGWGNGEAYETGDLETTPDSGVRGYYGPEREERGTPSEESDRPLGFPLDRHPQLDVFVPEAGHPPYGPGA
jgi:hypothetical protein